MRHYGLFWGEFGADLVGVKYCSHTLLLHAWVSVRRARAHPVGILGPVNLGRVFDRRRG